MERPSSGDEYQRPELDPNNPESIFLFAKKEQSWLKKIVAEDQHLSAIDFLAEKLERFVSYNFDGAPEVVVYTRDVSAGEVSPREPGKYVLSSDKLSLDSTDVRVQGGHVIRGVLHKFYCDEEADLRMYLDVGQPPVNTPGGVFTPLLSIAVEKADIRLAETEVNEQFGQAMVRVNKALENHEEEIRDIVKLLVTILENKEQTVGRKLKESSELLSEIDRRTESTDDTIDAVLDVIRIKLDLTSPQNMSVSQHRLPYIDFPRPAFHLKGPANFMAVTPLLELVGETKKKELGLYFLDEEQVAIQVPVRYVTDIRRS